MAKAKRGRPKGSKNKIVKEKVIKYKGKKGRPKGSKNRVKEDLSHIKISTFLGYCHCRAVITQHDLISKHIFICPHCNKKARVKQLSHTLNQERVQMSKKEYLENTINAKHIYSAPLLRVIDEKLIGENIDGTGLETMEDEK